MESAQQHDVRGTETARDVREILLVTRAIISPSVHAAYQRKNDTRAQQLDAGQLLILLLQPLVSAADGQERR